MPDRPRLTLAGLVTLLAAVLVLKVTAAVVLGYVNYLPPDFSSDFLHGRESYFYGDYRWAFYTHILSGPVALVLGLVLMSEAFRRRFPRWHRYLGRVQGVCVLLLVTPSGLWMAGRAAAGPVAGAGFAVLALLTGTTFALGWRAAVRRRFAEHRRWMERCFALLCSAVVIRVVGGTATVFGVGAEWFDVLAAWGCWLVPLAGLELGRRWTRGWALPSRPAHDHVTTPAS